MAPSSKACQDLVRKKSHSHATDDRFLRKINTNLPSAPGPNERRKESPESTRKCKTLVYLTVSDLSLLDSRNYQLLLRKLFLHRETCLQLIIRIISKNRVDFKKNS